MKLMLNPLKWTIRALLYVIDIYLLGDEKYSLNERDSKHSSILLSELLDFSHIDIKSEKLKLENEKEYNNQLKELEKNRTVQFLVLSYHRINEYISTVFNHEDASVHKQKALKVDENYSAIKDWKEFKTLRREIKSIAKEKLTEKKDIQTFKISISTADIATYVSLLGTLFIVSGFFKTQLYYKELGFDIGPFFTVQDYLTLNLGAISSLLISSILGIVAAYVGLNSRIKVPESILVKEQKRVDYEKYFVISTLILGAVVSYLLTKEHQYRLYQILFIIIIMTIAPRLAFRYFRNGIKAMFILIFCSYFVGSFIIDHFENKSNRSAKYSKYKVEFKNELSNIEVIGINSNYVFGRDTCNESSIIMPISEMKNIKIEK